jgi:hypothetical protein
MAVPRPMMGLAYTPSVTAAAHVSLMELTRLAALTVWGMSLGLLAPCAIPEHSLAPIPRILGIGAAFPPLARRPHGPSRAIADVALYNAEHLESVEPI